MQVNFTQLNCKFAIGNVSVILPFLRLECLVLSLLDSFLLLWVHFYTTVIKNTEFQAVGGFCRSEEQVSSCLLWLSAAK